MNKTGKSPVFVLLCSVLLLLVFMSCNAEVSRQGTVSRDPVSASGINDLLVGCYISGDYKLSEEQTQSALMDALVLLDKNTFGTSKSVSVSYEFTKTASFSYSMAGADSSKAAGDEYSVVFNDYEIVSDGHCVRHALVSDDMRIGPVLCVVDGELDTSMYFIEAFLEAVKQCADSVGFSWSAITAEDVESFRERYLPSVQESKLAACLLISGLEEYPEETFDSTVLPSVWHQGNPFNSAVRAVKGKDYPAGCANLAVAMICCYYGYPYSITASTAAALSNPSTAQLWSSWAASGGEVDWASIRKTDSLYNWDSLNTSDPVQLSAERSLSAFLLDCYLNTKSFRIDDKTTGTLPANVVTWLKNMGYKMDSFSSGKTEFPWSYENLLSSLSNGHPVLGYDLNHMFIADGMKSMRCGVYPVLGWFVSENPAAYLDHYRFVHMNYGWGGKGDGWYAEHVVSKALEILAGNKDPLNYDSLKVPTSLILNLCPDI